MCVCVRVCVCVCVCVCVRACVCVVGTCGHWVESVSSNMYNISFLTIKKYLLYTLSPIVPAVP